MIIAMVKMVYMNNWCRSIIEDASKCNVNIKNIRGREIILAP